MLLQQSLLFLSLFSANFGDGCRESYITLCDTFEDFEQLNNTETVSEVMIGSVSGPKNLTSVNFMGTLDLIKYPNLNSLKVIRVANDIKLTYGFQCSFENHALKFIILYGNELKTIKSYSFPLMKIKKMSLVNNQIEEIKPYAFSAHPIEELDLSENLLEVIESGALPNNVESKIITLKNNKIAHIEPDSFSKSLIQLHLDHNKLRYIQENVFADLVNLQSLTLSHNNFNTFKFTQPLKALKILDLSYNLVKDFEKGILSNSDDLRIVDLSNNKIEFQTVLHQLITPGKQKDMTISLALNFLRRLDPKDIDLQNQTLILHGNPWECQTWNGLQKKLKGHTSECEAHFLSEGNAPFCISYQSGGYYFNDMWLKDIGKFHDIVRKTEKKECNLAPKIQRILCPIQFGCVA